MPPSPHVSAPTRLRTAFIAIACAATACAAVTGVASADILGTGDAVRTANNHAQRIVNDPDTPYIRKVVSCQRLYEHIFRCGLDFDTQQTLSSPAYACSEDIEVFIPAHSAACRETATCAPTYYRHVKGLCD